MVDVILMLNQPLFGVVFPQNKIPQLKTKPIKNNPHKQIEQKLRTQAV